MKNFTILFFLCLSSHFFGQNDTILNFESKSYDFGTISSNSKALAKFEFINTSDSPVEITKIHGESHCIEIDTTSQRRYAPKERGIISIIYDTSCKGPIRKTLSVFTSVEDKTISLKLTGKVEN